MLWNILQVPGLIYAAVFVHCMVNFLSWQYVSAYIHKTTFSKHLGGRVYKQLSCVGLQKVMDGFNIEALCLNISERAGQGKLGWYVRAGLC